MTRLTVRDIRAMKTRQDKIAAVTAYDHSAARIADAAGIDLILVGDSLGTVVQGHTTTLPVTMDQMIYHTEMVSRGTARALVVGDMPFMSYQVSVAAALENAGRFLTEGRAAAIKLEGGNPAAMERISAMVEAGIPVMGHLGLTPQSVHAMGGYRVQGKRQEDADQMLEEAKALEQAGVFSMILEGIPEQLGQRISTSIDVPTIGIGAGVHCDGQILVWHDLLGLGGGHYPKFVKSYAELGAAATTALGDYAKEVRDGTFPGPDQTYH